MLKIECEVLSILSPSFLKLRFKDLLLVVGFFDTLTCFRSNNLKCQTEINLFNKKNILNE